MKSEALYPCGTIVRIKPRTKYAERYKAYYSDNLTKYANTIAEIIDYTIVSDLFYGYYLNCVDGIWSDDMFEVINDYDPTKIM